MASRLKVLYRDATRVQALRPSTLLRREQTSLGITEERLKAKTGFRLFLSGLIRIENEATGCGSSVNVGSRAEDGVFPSVRGGVHKALLIDSVGFPIALEVTLRLTHWSHVSLVIVDAHLDVFWLFTYYSSRFLLSTERGH